MFAHTSYPVPASYVFAALQVTEQCVYSADLILPSFVEILPNNFPV